MHVEILRLCWKCVGHTLENLLSKFGFVCLCFDQLRLKKLNSLTSIACLGGRKVTLQNRVREGPGSIPGSSKDFYVCFVSEL